MPLSDAAKERYVLAYMNERWQHRFSDGRPPEPFGDRLWGQILEDDDEYGTRFDVGHPDDIRRQVTAVAEAARKDLYAELREAAGRIVGADGQWFDENDIEHLQDWLTAQEEADRDDPS